MQYIYDMSSKKMICQTVLFNISVSSVATHVTESTTAMKATCNGISYNVRENICKNFM